MDGIGYGIGAGVCGGEMKMMIQLDLFFWFGMAKPSRVVFRIRIGDRWMDAIEVDLQTNTKSDQSLYVVHLISRSRSFSNIIRSSSSSSSSSSSCLTFTSYGPTE